ncbi:MAG TPA: amino acid adenylation domain-containing protein [Ktedonobacteraceae bacterium]|nr:amino acid adenylation domain-containing protein [Ktedonobacteraceae bacterium]
MNTVSSRQAFALSSEKVALLQRLLKKDKELPASIPKAPREEGETDFPLSFGQQRLWFLDQLEPGSSAYLIADALRLLGPLDVAALERSFAELIQRHEAFRTTFVAKEGQAVQRVHPPHPFRLPLCDLRSLPVYEREQELQRLLLEQARSPFDLSQGPLLRVRLWQLGEQEHVLLLAMHHIISDGWSMDVLRRELAALYAAFLGQQPSPLPPLPIQYADYALWQRARLQGETLRRHLAYWKKQLADLPPVLQLPLDRPRPPMQSFRGARYRFVVPESLARGLKQLSLSEGTTLFLTLFATFATLLTRYTGQEDIVIGTPIANRNRAEVDGVIGFFTNTLVMRTDLSGNPAFRDILRRLRAVALDAYEHQDAPWEQIVEIVQPERDLSYSPLFQVMFALEDVATRAIELTGLTVHPFPDGDETSKFDLSLSLREEAQVLLGSIEYNTDLFDAETIARFSACYLVLLAGIVTHPDQPIRYLSLLSEEERRLALAERKPSASDRAACQSLQELFEAQVRRTPQALAINGAFTYEEMNRRVNQLARYLQSRGVGPEAVVGLCVPRSSEMLVCLLAILKAGGAYLPLDPAYPQERLVFLLMDAGASLLLTTRQTAWLLQEARMPSLLLEDIGADLVGIAEDDPACVVAPTNLAYIIYTSGSTGKPKGVAITQGALARHCQVMARSYELGEADHVLQLASLNFDLAAEEIFPTFLSGACLVPCPSSALADFATFSRFVEQNELTVLNLSASYWHAWTIAIERGEAFLSASVRLVIVGNEAVQSEQLRHWQRLAGTGTRWCNAYGVTEATITTTLYQPDLAQPFPVSQAGVPIGRSLPHTRVYVLDPYGQPVPSGVPGELYIGGSGLARGYLHHPELTAERFVPNPFSDQPGERLYRTGDQVRYRSDGQLEYLGRIDQQVKLRGFRIEPGEIESVLQTYEGVGQAVVVVHEARPGEKRLVAYITAKERSMWITNDLRAFLEARLPQYMQPSAFVVLDELPMTANGKVDRRALMALAVPVTEQEEQGQGPRTPLEEIIAGIWSQVLGYESIDIDANFFALGGHSLLIMQVASRLRQSLGTALPLRRFFEQPTIRGLAQALEEEMKGEGQVVLPSLEVATREEPLPLSFAQQRLWFLDQLEPGNVGYTIPEAVRLRGKLNLHALERSFNEIVRRHEVLRTSIELVEGVPSQRISPPAYFSLPVQDLTQSAEPEQELQRILTQEMQKPFDLQRGPLLRVKILRLSADEHILFTNQHHIVSDGWSAGIMRRELTTLYQAYCSGEPSPLPPLTIQYADYAVWQRRWLQGEVLETQLNYWKQQLAGAPTVLELPTDRRRPALQSFRGASLEVVLSQRQVEGLKRLSREEGATLFMTLLASFMILLGRLSGQEEILVGTPVANRNRAEIEPLIGFFVNTLVLRGDLSGNPGFREVLQRVREVALSAYSHQDVPFEQVVEAIQPQRDLSRSPLFQVMFSLQTSTGGAGEFPGVSMEPVASDSKTTKFDLTLLFEENPAGLRGTLEYNSDLFEEATISDLLDSYLLLLDQIVASPEQRLGTFSLLTAAQRQVVLKDWNATRAEYPSAVAVHRLFEAQVAKTPDALAVRFADETLTYDALNRRANQLAHALQSLGVGAETRVGLCLDRSIAMVVAVFAVLKAGGAYLPLDLSWPAERYAFLLEDAGLHTVLTSSHHRQRFPQMDQPTKIICLDEAQRWLEQQPQTNPVQVHHPDQLAYLIYTSGSTGTPKGVMITHRGLVNYLHWGLERYQVAEGNGSLVHSSLSFDLTVTSLFLPLLAGRTVTLLPEEQQLEALSEAVQSASQGSLVKITPAHLAIVNAHLAEKKLASKSGVVVIGGEQLYREHLEAWQEQAPETIFMNEYGPTETVVGCCVYQVPAEQEEAGPVPIGRPIANTQMYLLDRWGQPVSRGMVGELYIAGVGLARGYLHRPALTAERFLPNPFSDQPGARLYRTGDLARYQPDGTLEFLGRNDTQIKLRGYRIELGEIESLLRQHPLIEDCAVLLRAERNEEKRLVAHVVLKKDQELDRSRQELRSMLQKHLPQYMVPSAFLPQKALPLTSNGKIDIQALSAQALKTDDLSAGKGAPRDRVELRLTQIWEELLPGAAVRITDDFFASGGHSLLALRLMAHIQEEFGQHLPLSALFQGATIEHLADLLRQGQHEGAISSLVPIQRARSGHPLFCVHPIGGEVLCYLELARALGQEQPVSAFQAVGLYGEQAPYQSIEALAGHYIQELRTRQSDGPYTLCGWSMGGVIAFEMARQLQEAGQEIAHLILLDSYVPDSSGHEDSPQGEIIQFIEDIANLLGIEEELSSLQLELLAPDRQMERFLDLVHQLHLWPENTGLSSLQDRLRVFQANGQALRTYKPRAYPGHLHLIRASEQMTEGEQDRTLGWSELAQGGIDLQILPGTHYTLMKKPDVQVLAEQLRAYLS